MGKLRLAKRGQSFQHANPSLRPAVGVAGDVLELKREIEGRWPEIEIYFDHDRGKEPWVVVEHCKDGTDRLVFTADELDRRIIERLHRADQQVSGHVDVLERIDNHNAGIEKEQDARFSEQIGEAAERLAFALKQDGIHNHADIYGGRSNRRRRRR